MTPPIRCQQVVEFATDWLEGALAEERSSEVTGHLAACPACAEYLGQLRMVAGVSAALSAEDVTERPLADERRAELLAAFRKARAYE